jgi:hypothetical protein
MPLCSEPLYSVSHFIQCYAECHYAEGCYAEFRYSEGRYTECRENQARIIAVMF